MVAFIDNSLPHISYTLIAVLALSGYLLCLSFYRLYLSPLAKFPGPKLAALSAWYAGYHDLVRGGQYVWVVEEMHRQYGPIVRVRPDALHINDPNFIDVLYSSSPKHRRERYKTVLQTLQAPGSVLATKDHELHRIRRSKLNSFFSKQNVRRLEPMINRTLSTLLHRMQGWARTGEPIRLNNAFSAATKDVIQAYAFGPGESYLEMEDCNAAFFDIVTPQRVCHLGTYIFWLAYAMTGLPPPLLRILLPRVGVFEDYINSLMREIERIRNDKEQPNQRTIFHEILASDIPDSEKEIHRLTDEAMIILVAGSETTASTLAAVFYHLLSDRPLLTRLKAELETAMPDPTQAPSAATVDTLPFLNAVIQETIRLYPGATHRQDRVAPDEDLPYTDPDGIQYLIPAGTAIGMTAPLINRHPSIYDRPNEFLPDRYLENPGLSRYLMSFSKGLRMCVGINLAYQELLTFTAGVFRVYDMFDGTGEQKGPTMELYGTRREDVSMWADYITPGVRPGSHGLRVRIRE